MTIDLHIHSTSSDGTMSPADLVAYAHKKGLSAIAITDHDTIDGIEEAVLAAKSFGIEVVPGIELSVLYGDRTVHLLGYLFDVWHKDLHAVLGRLQAGRLKRNRTIIANLNRLGMAVSFAELEKISGLGQTGRPHIARLLMQKGYVKTMNEAFVKYLGQGGQAYASRFAYGAREIINLINACGGLAVLAHPLQLRILEDELSFMLENLVEMGLDGIEVYYPTHSRQHRKQLAVWAKKHCLLMTGGSDYHGRIRPNTTLAGGKNVSVPDHLLVKMKQSVERDRKK